MNTIKNAKEMIESDSLNLRGKSLLSIGDLNSEQLFGLLRITQAMDESHKAKIKLMEYGYPRSVALIFEKPSLRTRVTFELGIRQLGGFAVVLGQSDINMGKRESIPDIARNLGRWTDAIVARVFDHNSLVGLAEYSGVPVINALSDVEHPCQILADLYTIIQKKGGLNGVRLAWMGDGNNVLHSILLAAGLSGMRVCAACPKGYEPKQEIVAKARELAGEPSGADTAKSSIQIVTDPEYAMDQADVVYTDVWTSMGWEDEREQRLKDFHPYQVNAKLMSLAKSDAIFMHCLPAHRGEEVTDEVLESAQSVVFDEAENRLHAQKAVMACLIN